MFLISERAEATNQPISSFLEFSLQQQCVLQFHEE